MLVINMKKRGLIIVLVVIILILIGYFLFSKFYIKNCDDVSCFNNALIKCKRASYINDAEDAAWKYIIKGKVEDRCKVNVKLLQLKTGTSEMSVLEGKDMDCYVPVGKIIQPQSNLGNCHGILKEEMQSLIINKLHNYIVGNIGKISEGLVKPL